MPAKPVPRAPHLDDAITTDIDEAAETAASIVHHPDGWYWVGARPQEQFGPYASAEQARAAMLTGADDDLEADETLQEAEDELGLADWVDPETGGLAEDVHTRIEDH